MFGKLRALMEPPPPKNWLVALYSKDMHCVWPEGRLLLGNHLSPYVAQDSGWHHEVQVCNNFEEAHYAGQQFVLQEGDESAYDVAPCSGVGLVYWSEKTRAKHEFPGQAHLPAKTPIILDSREVTLFYVPTEEAGKKVYKRLANDGDLEVPSTYFEFFKYGPPFVMRPQFRRQHVIKKNLHQTLDEPKPIVKKQKV